MTLDPKLIFTYDAFDMEGGNLIDEWDNMGEAIAWAEEAAANEKPGAKYPIREWVAIMEWDQYGRPIRGIWPTLEERCADIYWSWTLGREA